MLIVQQLSYSIEFDLHTLVRAYETFFGQNNVHFPLRNFLGLAQIPMSSTEYSQACSLY